MNEGNFVARGMKIGGNLRRNFDGISYVNFGGQEPNPKLGSLETSSRDQPNKSGYLAPHAKFRRRGGILH